MTTTPNLEIRLLEAAQAQKEITVNEALMRLDALSLRGALARAQTPPPAPQDADIYIIGDAPQGVWADYAQHITYFDQIWRFIAPKAAMILWVEADRRFYHFDGTSWRAATAVEA